ncbi:MAG TPA: S24/S26 family peptidase [Polyangia bacterium]|nr:S24/S26 family peptidase [Polyangia bacterium]
MLPTVRDGEHLIVAPASAREIVRGDVVLCETWRGPVAHRVEAVETNAEGASRFLLRGDASLTLDRPVPASALLGRVVGVERHGRTLSVAFSGGDLGRLWMSARMRLRPTLDAARGWLAPSTAVRPTR